MKMEIFFSSFVTSYSRHHCA